MRADLIDIQIEDYGNDVEIALSGSLNKAQLSAVREKLDTLMSGPGIFFFLNLERVHFAVDDYLDMFLDAGADLLTVHAEVSSDLHAMLHKIHRRGAKTGIALKPGTGISAVEPYLDEADMILTMTVEPGFGGQKLDEHNLQSLIDRGLTVAVMGTALYRCEDPKAMMARLHAMGEQK